MLDWRLNKRGQWNGQEDIQAGADHQQACEAEVMLSQGSTVGEASQKLSVTGQTYYRWRRKPKPKY